MAATKSRKEKCKAWKNLFRVWQKELRQRLFARQRLKTQRRMWMSPTLSFSKCASSW